ncbi:hypothetical protein C2L65_19135 [Paraburkholderia terrae]|uniref:Uncharacterized protein n=1 Tax=Paraburkholderia terrae TaxID=311230 RepID=A0A2I8ESP2_9BURK|nr:hypothetical protein C2L65_19135 [Paraburkholderia terrae]
MTSVETAPAVRSPSRPTVVMRGAAALADSDAEPVAPGFTALPRNARRRAQAGDRAIQYPPPVSRLSNRRHASAGPRIFMLIRTSASLSYRTFTR